MLPERTSTKLTDTHKNNKRNLCNWVSLYPCPSPLLRLLEQGVPFRGTKTSRRVDVFWPRADAPVVTFTQLPTPPLLLFCLPIVDVVTHTTWPQHTVHTHTRGTHCYHTQVIIVKPSQTKHDLLNGSIPFNLFPINWKKSNGQCTIRQVEKEKEWQRETDTEGSGGVTRLGKGASIFHVCCELFHVFPLQLVFSPLDFGYNAIRIPSESHSCCWEKRQGERERKREIWAFKKKSFAWNIQDTNHI